MAVARMRSARPPRRVHSTECWQATLCLKATDRRSVRSNSCFGLHNGISEMAVACAARMHHSYYSVTRVFRWACHQQASYALMQLLSNQKDLEEMFLTSELRVCAPRNLKLLQQPR
jgi:hypothetical protein